MHKARQRRGQIPSSVSPAGCVHILHIICVVSQESLSSRADVDEWTAFPGLLASPRVPPLSRRLILTLLFGVYVVSPFLDSSSTGSESESTTKCAHPPHIIFDTDLTRCVRPIPPNLYDFLRSYMSLRIDEERGAAPSGDDSDLNPLPYAPLLERTEYAMALSLFAVWALDIYSNVRF